MLELLIGVSCPCLLMKRAARTPPGHICYIVRLFASVWVLFASVLLTLWLDGVRAARLGVPWRSFPVSKKWAKGKPKGNQRGAKGHPKIDFDAESWPERLQERSGGKRAGIFEAILIVNGAPRVEFGSQLGRPGGPKSHFLAKSQHKIVKKSFQEGFQKKHEKIIKKWCRK